MTPNDIVKAAAVPVAVATAVVAPVTLGYVAASWAAGFFAGRYLKSAAKKADYARSLGFKDAVPDSMATKVATFIGDVTEVAAPLCPVLPVVAVVAGSKLNSAVDKCCG